MPSRKPRRKTQAKAPYQRPQLERLGSLREVTAKTGARPDNRPHPSKP